jgi:hypothetical protein
MSIGSIGAQRIPFDQSGSRPPSPPAGAGTPTDPVGTPPTDHQSGDRGIRPLLSGDEQRFFEGLFPGSTAVIRTYGPPGGPEPAGESVGRFVDRKG